MICCVNLPTHMLVYNQRAYTHINSRIDTCDVSFIKLLMLLLCLLQFLCIVETCLSEHETIILYQLIKQYFTKKSLRRGNTFTFIVFATCRGFALLRSYEKNKTGFIYIYSLSEKKLYYKK